ncbi:uncharacterized protein LOC108344043 isoform X3 [Vigna angularis]|uniref:uncharacterized protein LOC108344043 isoform X3 n=1 Tax=Phaseolus angularis TaxID=3914 RepID=UPI0022B4BC4E|nr:uncharacterized protein LOC108344043 isoform X3 [Vigna angularis]
MEQTRYHPDMNKSPGAEEKFKEISAAYEMRRKDLYMIVLVSQVFKKKMEGQVVLQGCVHIHVFHFLQSQYNWWILLIYLIHSLVVLMEYLERVMQGASTSILVTRETIVMIFGAKSKNCIKQCINCGGRGGEMKSQRTPFGMMSQVSTCSKCSGLGKIITDHCRRCDGSGQVQSKETIEVDIPAGVNDGDTMQIQGQGNFDKKRQITGDLFVVLHVDEKQGIWREGLHLYSKINIDFTDAILGSVKKVETVEGLRDLQIPSGIQPGDSVKLSRLGVPDMNKPFVRGNHYFIVNVLIPKDISGTQRVLVEQLASLRASNRRDSLSSGDNGIPKGKFNEFTKRRDPRGDGSSKGIKNVDSLWGSIKNFLSGRQSDERFASISMDTSALIRRYADQRPSVLNFSFVAFVAFVVTWIFALIAKSKYSMLQKRPESLNRTLKKN